VEKRGKYAEQDNILMEEEMKGRGDESKITNNIQKLVRGKDG
jgi:hypothetical protein